MENQDSTAPAKAHVTKKSFWKKIRELRPTVKFSLVIIIVLSFMTIFAEWVVLHDPYEPDLLFRNKPPSLQNVLGTDQIGRDTLSRTIYAIRTSVGIALYGVFSATFIGIMMGISAGFIGGWTDRIISSIIDFFYAVPYLLLMLVGIVILGRETWVLIVLISFARWHDTARLVRGQVFSLREVPAIEAAVALGSSRWRVAFRHILPNLTSIIVVDMSIKFPSLILLESTLSFLGVGVQPPIASLGSMVGAGRNYLINNPILCLAPALTMVTIVMCFQVLGDWIRDTSDVRYSD